MRRSVTAALLIFAVQTPAYAQTVEELSAKAVDASMAYMSATLFCADLVGDSYISVGRLMLQSAVRAHGVTGDALTIQVDDLEQHLRKQAEGRTVRNVMAQQGMTETVALQFCQTQLSDGLRATEVATARYRQATGR